MNEHEWLDDELSRIARDDARTAVPLRIEAAVMEAWDGRRIERGTNSARRGIRRRWVVATGLAAAAVILVLVRLEPGPPVEPTQARQAPPAPQAPHAVQAPQALQARDAAWEPIARLPAAVIAEAPDTREYVLVPDPFADVTAMNVVRVRMSRVAFASLGVPMANPDADGLVEVEMLVGDDGVARTIRRATFVDDRVDGGGEQ